jgi:hypothetical protein
MRIWLTIVALTLTAGPVIAQLPVERWGEGTEVFRRVLKQEGLTPLEYWPTPGREPKNQILIVLGKTDILDAWSRDGTLRGFLRGGGAVLIATDHATPASLRKHFGVRVTGEIIPAPPSECWREMPQCPFAKEVRRNWNRHPIFQGLSDPSRLATNNPSYLADSSEPPIAVLPSYMRFFSVNGSLLHDEMNWRDFACVREFGRGRLLVIADHSIFINDMMLQSDNDNFAFAFNVVRWLTDAGDGKRRDEVLFYDDGQIRTDFNVPLEYQMPPIPPLEAFIQPADEAIVEAERKNLLNDTLLDMTGGLRPILRAAALVLTLALLLFGLYRFLNSRYRQDAGLVELPPATQAGQTAVERRHQAVIDRGNYAEAARELAHQAFAAVGLTPVADAPPAVSVTGWLPFRGRRWAREVRSLWRLAVRGPRRRVSAAALRRLDRAIHELLAAIAAGRVRLARAESTI